MNYLQHKILSCRVNDVVVEFVENCLPFTAQDITVKVIEMAKEEGLGFSFSHIDVNDIIKDLFKKNEFQFMGIPDDVLYKRTSIPVQSNSGMAVTAWLYHTADYNIIEYDNCKYAEGVASTFEPNPKDIEPPAEPVIAVEPIKSVEVVEIKPEIKEKDFEDIKIKPARQEKECCDAFCQCNQESEDPVLQNTMYYASKIKEASSSLLENTMSLSFVLGLKLADKIGEAIDKIK